MPPAIILSDRIAIVTGGRRQLGVAQAIRLAECGADVCLVDLDHDDGNGGGNRASAPPSWEAWTFW